MDEDCKYWGRLAAQGDLEARARFQRVQQLLGLPLERSYALVPEAGSAPTYAEGVHLVHEACKRELFSPHPARMVDGSLRFVPLTFAGNIEAFLDHHDQTAGRPIEERILSEHTHLESATGIACKAGTTRFKIIPYCQQLIEIPRDSQERFLPCDYDNLEGDQLDSSEGVYDDWLTLPQALGHLAWEKAIPNKDVRERFMRITYEQFPRRRPQDRPDQGMGFFVSQNREKDELRALFLCDADYSDALCDDGLNDPTRFVQVRPRGGV